MPAWLQMPVYPNGYFGAAFDPSGDLVVLAGHDASTVYGLDPQTGDQRWFVQPPFIFTSFGFGTAGSLVALGGQGMVALLRDP